MVKDLKPYYQEKKVFLTGHTGFKGSWLLLWLHALGAVVKGYSLDPESQSLYNKMNGDELCESVIHDIRDAERVKEEIISFQPDYIFHLAAQPLVRRSYEIPTETYEVNVNGTMYVLEAVRSLNKPCSVVIITTDKVYHNIESDYAYKEDDKLGGFDPYSASKAAAEIVVSSYRDSFFNPVNYSHHHKGIAVARAGNVIGGGDYAQDRIIPDIVKALEAKQDVLIRNPTSVRPWQHVLEPLWGYLQLGAALSNEGDKFSTAFNFGPDPEDILNVKELVELSIKEWGEGSFTMLQLNHAPHEAGLLKLNNTKSKIMLQVYPIYSSADAIAKTILWYKLAKEKGYREFSLDQINQYLIENHGV